MSEATSEAPKSGRRPPGVSSHKPDCKCNPCASRRRKEEAELGGTGQPASETSQEIDPVESSEKPEEILHAELTPYIATGNTARDRVAQWITMRAKEPGITNAEVARRLGIQPGTMNTILTRARKEGWLVIEDPLDRVQFDIIPQIVENLDHFLKARDKTVTIEAAKGVVFPSYRESRGIVENKVTVLGLQIQLPEQTGDVERKGRVVGQPKIIEGSVVSTKIAGSDDVS